MAKWNARAFVNVTFDFEIEADTEQEVERRVKQYLKFVNGGKPETQALSLKTKDEDELTGLFIDVDEVTDIYDL